MASRLRMVVIKGLLLLLATASVSLIYLLFSLDDLQTTFEVQHSYPDTSGPAQDRVFKPAVIKDFPHAEATLHLLPNQMVSLNSVPPVNTAPHNTASHRADRREGARWSPYKDSISASKTHQAKSSEPCNCSQRSQVSNEDSDSFNNETPRESPKYRQAGRHVNFYISKQNKRSAHESGSQNKPAVYKTESIHLKSVLRAKIHKASSQLEDVLALLERLRGELNVTWSSSLGSRIPEQLQAGIQVVENLIKSLSPEEDDTGANNTPEKRPNLRSVVLDTNNDSGTPLKEDRAWKAQTSEPEREVFCRETFKGTLYGYPFYEKGFVVEPCREQPALEELLTLVFNFADYPQHLLADASRVLKQVRRIYPNIAVLMATRRAEANHFADINVLHRLDVENEATRPATVWNSLLSRVTTPFAFIGRKLLHFDTDASLERLVREISTQGAGIIGGATRTLDGRWSIDCYQMSHRNYTLVYRQGYHLSRRECLRCNHIQGPFVVRTSLLRSHPLDDNIPATTLFEDYFLSLLERGVDVVVCPDVMFHVTFPDGLTDQKHTWIMVAAKWRLNRIRTASGHLHVFMCSDIHMDCSFTTGLAVPPCCLEVLSKQIKFIMRTCEENHIICELQEGTLLGAVKLGKVLPWERDGDITFLSSNFSSLAALKGLFSSGGYILKESGSTRCCVEDKLAGGVFTVVSSGAHSPWTIEMYGYHRTDSEALLQKGLQPTKVFLDGAWVAAPRNPGKHLRNRYGHDIYKHVQHWISLGKYNGWDEYIPTGFTPCPLPGRHDCLDVFSVDGNLQFEDPRP